MIDTLDNSCNSIKKKIVDITLSCSILYCMEILACSKWGDTVEGSKRFLFSNLKSTIKNVHVTPIDQSIVSLPLPLQNPWNNHLINSRVIPPIPSHSHRQGKTHYQQFLQSRGLDNQTPAWCWATIKVRSSSPHVGPVMPLQSYQSWIEFLLGGPWDSLCPKSISYHYGSWFAASLSLAILATE
jgi:hypothetical protein